MHTLSMFPKILSHSSSLLCGLTLFLTLVSAQTAEQGFSESLLENVSGSQIEDVVASPAYYAPNFLPSSVKTLPLSVTEESSARKLQGVIVPETSGVYHFWLMGDDTATVSISADDSKFGRKQIAQIKSPTISNDTLGASRDQYSLSVNLEEGKRYYIQIDHKQGTGEGFLNVKWAASSKGLVNWARDNHATATQSSTRTQGGAASRATDGNTSGDFSSNSITHTDPNFTGMNWWQVDLNADRVIDRIQIHNRDLDADVVKRRLSNFRVSVSNKAGEITFSQDFHTDGSTTVEAVEYIETNGIIGGVVRIEQLGPNATGDNILSLAEVEVLGRANEHEQYLPISGMDVLNVEPFEEDGSDQDLDDLNDAWEQKHGFDSSVLQDGDYAPYADKDKDGYTNIQESGRNSNPFEAESTPGALTVERWSGQYYFSVSDFVESSAYYEQPSSSGLATTLSYRSLSQYQAARLRGYLIAPESGYYTFWVSGTTGAELWLSSDDTKYHKQRIAGMGGDFGTGTRGISVTNSNRFDQFSSQQSEPVYLEEGKSYFLEALSQQHHEGNRARNVSVVWARPNRSRSRISMVHITSYGLEEEDKDDDYLPDAWEEEYGLDASNNGKYDSDREGEYGDFDGDGLINRDEYAAGTNPANADSDGDGYNDFYEVVQAGSDPNTVNVLSIATVGSVDLTTATSEVLEWTENNGLLSSDDFRGDISWQLNVPEEGNWVLNIATELLGNIGSAEEVRILAYIDDKLLEEVTLKYGSNGEALLRLITPHLTAGDHTLKLFIDNNLTYRRVAIESFTVGKPTGLDYNFDGVVDWVQDELNKLNNIKPFYNTSVVSPAFIEGSARSQALVNGEQAEIATSSKHWYYDVELQASDITPFAVEFEEDFAVEGSIAWVETNVMDNGNLVIRQGDSLKLVAIPEQGLYGETVTYIIGGQSFAEEDASVGTAFEFVEPGEHTVQAVLSNGNTGTLTVNVKKANFTGVTDLASNSERVLNFLKSQVDYDLYFDGGEQIKVADKSDRNDSSFWLYLQPQGQGLNKVAARLYEGGPIVGTKDYNLIRLNDGLENESTRSFRSTEFPGQRLVITTITADQIPEGGYIVIDIFRSGVTFLDGTTSLRLTAEDFQNGSYNLQFLFNNGLTGGFCHYLSLYDRTGKLISVR